MAQNIRWDERMARNRNGRGGTGGGRWSAEIKRGRNGKPRFPRIQRFMGAYRWSRVTAGGADEQGRVGRAKNSGRGLPAAGEGRLIAIGKVNFPRMLHPSVRRVAPPPSRHQRSISICGCHPRQPPPPISNRNLMGEPPGHPQELTMDFTSSFATWEFPWILRLYWSPLSHI